MYFNNKNNTKKYYFLIFKYVFFHKESKTTNISIIKILNKTNNVNVLLFKNYLHPFQKNIISTAFITKEYIKIILLIIV